MSLLERIRANRCAVQDCQRERAPDAAVCRDDLVEQLRHHLDRQADGTFRRRRIFPARDLTGQITSHAA